MCKTSVGDNQVALPMNPIKETSMNIGPTYPKHGQLRRAHLDCGPNQFEQQTCSTKGAYTNVVALSRGSIVFLSLAPPGTTHEDGLEPVGVGTVGLE